MRLRSDGRVSATGALPMGARRTRVSSWMRRSLAGFALVLATSLFLPQVVSSQPIETNPPVVVELALPNATLGAPYSTVLVASGGTAPYAWTILTGAVPLGLVLDSEGVLAGIPGAVGPTTLAVRLTDAAGGTSTATLTLDVAPPPPPIQQVTVVATSGLITTATNAGAPGTVGTVPPIASSITGVVGAHDEVAVASSPSGSGTWILLSSGRVVPIGAVSNYGRVPSRLAKGGVVGIAVDRAGTGYWIVTRSGHVFGFGSAHSKGSLKAIGPGARVVGIASGPGDGYYLLQADGKVTGFGTAARQSSFFLRHLHLHLAGIASTSDGSGYWVVASNGSIFAFYGAKSEPIPGTHSHGTIVAVASSATGSGLYLLNREGSVYSYGGAISLAPIPIGAGARFVGIAASS